MMEQEAPLPVNDPKLFAPVRIRVIKPFYIEGRLVCKDDIVKLGRFNAESLQAIGRCEILE